MTPSPRTPLIALIAVLGCVASGRAAAQATPGFALDHFEPSEQGSEWFVSESLDLRGRTRPAIGVASGWAHQPLLAVNPDGSTRAVLVGDQTLLYVGGTVVVVDRVRFGIELPAALYGTGNPAGTLGAPDSFGVGDLRLGTDVRLYGVYGDLVTVAAGLHVFLPTGSRTAYLSDGSARLRPRVLAAGERGAFVYAAALAFEYRPDERPVPNTDLGSSVLFSVSAGARLLGRALVVGPEIFGGTTVTGPDAAFGPRNTPVEALLGGHYTSSSFRVGLGAGPGLTRGLGSPAWRALASFEWAPADMARVRDERSASGLEPGACPDGRSAHASSGAGGCLPDRDADTIADAEDACPDLPGVASTDPKRNGCPPDRDGDSIPDAEDACPDVPGVRSGDAKLNGCPPDRDGDGLPDQEDACPDAIGVRTTDPKTNGCPVDPDRDHDGTANEVDACPDVAGPANADPQKNGCPLAFVEGDRIRITDEVQFRTGTAVLDPSSEDTLMAVRKILTDHESIHHLQVQGHTDSMGSAARNQKLSEDRASSVRRWLIAHGIASPRLSSTGFGSTRPLVSNEDEEGRRQNRRVEFHIETSDSPDSHSQ
jgi:OOP family OmpA-OmpF porin